MTQTQASNHLFALSVEQQCCHQNPSLPLYLEPDIAEESLLAKNIEQELAYTSLRTMMAAVEIWYDPDPSLESSFCPFGGATKPRIIFSLTSTTASLHHYPTTYAGRSNTVQSSIPGGKTVYSSLFTSSKSSHILHCVP
ncbi:hypothetical protein DEU56DRAFT_739150 [Suillus clintonianus]|uniref:uncharacterized protein n=1 Tax=Suillus clintonianus TaxID=1904413 RepID=UPI001B8698AF|nr:uncharacterized protein DEU56DRAFT_739180 [Suillus clintonianus]XP_041207111.1 uncharacterized protein DEU56DRAFT_739150 [Suillus clintonianus]KAG2132995.1 hypothetical protein DEU56DRAFT_739180 [Suillus clintonianus]KAG2132999.1 hypothetical protein DEU56DRAFT_739150 [Suillus clintonianus]